MLSRPTGRNMMTNHKLRKVRDIISIKTVEIQDMLRRFARRRWKIFNIYKVKKLEVEVSTSWPTKLYHQISKDKGDSYTFYIITSKELHGNTSKSEWIVDSSCIHHMAKDASLFLH